MAEEHCSDHVQTQRRKQRKVKRNRKKDTELARAVELRPVPNKMRRRLEERQSGCRRGMGEFVKGHPCHRATRGICTILKSAA
jgi:hypothetical protein